MPRAMGILDDDDLERAEKEIEALGRPKKEFDAELMASAFQAVGSPDIITSTPIKKPSRQYVARSEQFMMRRLNFMSRVFGGQQSRAKNGYEVRQIKTASGVTYIPKSTKCYKASGRFSIMNFCPRNHIRQHNEEMSKNDFEMQDEDYQLADLFDTTLIEQSTDENAIIHQLMKSATADTAANSSQIMQTSECLNTTADSIFADNSQNLLNASCILVNSTPTKMYPLHRARSAIELTPTRRARAAIELTPSRRMLFANDSARAMECEGEQYKENDMYLAGLRIAKTLLQNGVRKRQQKLESLNQRSDKWQLELAGISMRKEEDKNHFFDLQKTDEVLGATLKHKTIKVHKLNKFLSYEDDSIAATEEKLLVVQQEYNRGNQQAQIWLQKAQSIENNAQTMANSINGLRKKFESSEMAMWHMERKRLDKLTQDMPKECELLEMRQDVTVKRADVEKRLQEIKYLKDNLYNERDLQQKIDELKSEINKNAVYRLKEFWRTSPMLRAIVSEVVFNVGHVIDPAIKAPAMPVPAIRAAAIQCVPPTLYMDWLMRIVKP